MMDLFGAQPYDPYQQPISGGTQVSVTHDCQIDQNITVCSHTSYASLPVASINLMGKCHSLTDPMCDKVKRSYSDSSHLRYELPMSN
jgi:hypothetical protein